MKKKTYYGFCLLFLVLLAITACKKDTFYEVNPVDVSQTGADKPNLKSNIELISIAYSDLFGSSISQSQLNDLSGAYESFGDKNVLVEIIIKNMLNTPGVNLPAAPDMRADIPGFIDNTYRKLYNRQPNEFERWFLEDQIAKDTTLSPELIYYSMMTANEYRYY